MWSLCVEYIFGLKMEGIYLGKRKLPLDAGNIVMRHFFKSRGYVLCGRSLCPLLGLNSRKLRTYIKTALILRPIRSRYRNWISARPCNYAYLSNCRCGVSYLRILIGVLVYIGWVSQLCEMLPFNAILDHSGAVTIFELTDMLLLPGWPWLMHLYG